MNHSVSPLIAFCCLLISATSLLAQRDLKDIPDPAPELERQTFVVADGFEVNLFAGDPQIAKPIQMNFDAQGRLWIASSEVYPHIEPGQPATDKILVLEDSDGDGQADKTTVFADGLLIPTGVVPDDQGGAYVANSTELLHLEDTDGDLKADRRRVTLSGFGTEDTHHLLHTLRWGHDGQLYMNQSIYIHSHVETPYGVKHLNGGGIWRFRPETLELDVLCRGFVNPWGHHFNRWGANFATDGAYGEGINYVFPGAVYVTAVGLVRRLEGLNPGSPKHCGLEILSGRHLPDEWQGDMLTNDFRAHRVCRFVVSEDGSGYASRQETELIKTSHVAFRPIDVKVGPDGAIYIADWYNPIIQHGEVDFRDPRRDHVHGRIWRVTYKGGPVLKKPELVGATIEQLLEQLKAPEEFTRLHAKLILKSRGAEAVLPKLEAWLASLTKEGEVDPQWEHNRLEGLWLHQSLNTVNEKLLQDCLASRDHRVRAAAMRVASQWRVRLEDPIDIPRRGVDDEHPRVRLEAVRMLAEFQDEDGPRAARIAARVLDQSMDRFLDFALWQTMRDLAPSWLPAVREGRLEFDQVDHLTFALKAVDSPDVVGPLLALVAENKVDADSLDGVLELIASLGGPQQLRQVLDAVLAEKSSLADDKKAALLDTLVAASRQRKVTPSGDLASLTKLFEQPNPVVRAAAVRAAGVWKLKAIQEELKKLATADDRVPQTVRHAACDALASLGDKPAIDTLAEVAQSSRPFDDRQQAVTALAAVNLERAAQLTAKLLADAPADADVDVDGLVAAIVSRQQGPGLLSRALKETELTPDVAKLTLRAAQRSGRDAPPLLETIRAAGKLGEFGWKLTPELMEELVAEVRDAGDGHRGEEVYRRQHLQCQKCHAVGGAGGRVGPDLVSVGASAQIDYLIESLLVPAAKVKENFHSLQVVTDDGKIVSGIPVRETKTELVLRDAEGKLITIAIDSIELRKEGRSLMPDGAADQLTRGELVDLVRFLSELGKVGEFAVSNRQLVRSWQAMLYTQEGNRRLNRTSFDTAATDDPDLSWTPVYSRVGGDLPLDELNTFKPHRENDPTSFVRFQLDVTTPGEIRLNVGPHEGLSLWLNGKPKPLAGDEITLDAPSGRSTVTLAVNQVKRSEPLLVELLEVPGSAASAKLVLDGEPQP
ncbi:MAG: HEAT repeat domain-containing protein [Pirellulaceae bacterium]